jgi:hypothetical protein
MRPPYTVLNLAAFLAMSANAETILTVRVYNYTHLSDNEIVKAEVVARRIFRKAGVGIIWIHCAMERGEEYRFPECRNPRSESDIILQVVPQSMENRSLSAEAFGYALQASGGLPSRHAYVFFHRVEQAVRNSQRTSRAVSQPSLLGHVVAHEIGHLILGPNSHSNHGVMKAGWSQKELQEMEIGQLVFAAEQAKVIRGRLDGRANGSGK